jgi:hypothetical protein
MGPHALMQIAHCKLHIAQKAIHCLSAEFTMLVIAMADPVKSLRAE